MTHPIFARHGDRWTLPIAGELVTRCSYDHQFTLHVGELAPPWNVHGPGSMLMVSGTDGELIIWS